MGKRIVFMGTPEFAVPSLRALIGAGHDVVAVVTRPDRPRGRGREALPSPVKAVAVENSIEVLEPVRLRDEGFLGKLRGLGPDLIVVVAYGKILPEDVLGIPPMGCVNVHASILPRYRGAAPINWAIIRGERETGVTTMLMDRGMDTGPILIEERTPIGENETALDLSKRLSEMGARLLVRTIGLMSEGRLTPRPQDDSLATYAPMLKKEDGEIDWNGEARKISDMVRGFYPWPGAYTRWKGALLKVHSGKALGEGGFEGIESGTVVYASDEGIGVKCGTGVFEIRELQPENKRRMDAADFVKGYRIKKGDVLAR